MTEIHFELDRDLDPDSSHVSSSASSDSTHSRVDEQTVKLPGLNDAEFEALLDLLPASDDDRSTAESASEASAGQSQSSSGQHLVEESASQTPMISAAGFVSSTPFDDPLVNRNRHELEALDLAPISYVNSSNGSNSNYFATDHLTGKPRPRSHTFTPADSYDHHLAAPLTRAAHELWRRLGNTTPRSPKLVGADFPFSPMSPLQLSPSKPGTPRMRPVIVESSHLSVSDVQYPRDILPSVSHQVDRADFPRLPVQEFTHSVSRLRHQVVDLQTRIEELRPRIRNSTPLEALEGLGIQRTQQIDQLLQSEARYHDPVQGGTDHAEITPAFMLAEEGITRPDDADVHTGDRRVQDPQHLLAALSLPPDLAYNSFISHDSYRQNLSQLPRDLPDIQRALLFMSQVDELVWRRSTHNTDDRPQHIFGEENFLALLDRIRLWENAVRVRH